MGAVGFSRNKACHGAVGVSSGQVVRWIGQRHTLVVIVDEIDGVIVGCPVTERPEVAQWVRPVTTS